MTQSTRLHILALAAIAFLALLLLLAQTLPNEPKPDTVKSVHWSAQQSMGEYQNSDSETWQGADWSRFAYVQYITNAPYLCSSVMLFESLHRLGCKADRLMMYPSGFSLDSNGIEPRLLTKAQDEYNVKLKPIDVQRKTDTHDSTWAESYTKLLAFNQTEYQRVLHLDSDSTVLQCMDELLVMKPAQIAMPRAYWLGFEDRVLSSQLLLLQPSNHEFDRVMNATENAGNNDYDMDILTSLYKDSAMVIPHRPYDLLTGEFRGNDHQRYLQDPQEEWDPDAVLEEAKYMHFSDWPLPKPWLATPDEVDDRKPPCRLTSANNETENEDCRDQHIWVGAYTEFRRRRKEICDLEV